MDQNSKYGGFCVKYKKRYGVPQVGDIIKTSTIINPSKTIKNKQIKN